MARSQSVDIYQPRYTKAELLAVPEPERMFYLLATGLANDLQVLIRQYTIAIRQWDDDKVKRDSSSAVAMLNLRLLAGRFYEGWKLISERWEGLEASYEPDLSMRGKEALAGLRAHFAVGYKQNLVRVIRDKVGLHSEYKHAKLMLNAVPADADFIEYLGQQYGDTLYFGSEVLHYQTLRNITGEVDDVKAFGAVMDDVRKLQDLFLTFINAMVRVFAQRHFAEQLAKLESEKHTLNDLPDFDAARIPYFANFSGSSERVGETARDQPA